MTGKNSILFGLSILIIISALTVLGCKTSEGKMPADNNISENTIPNNTIPGNTIPDDGKSFSSSITGTWKKDNFSHTITFTKNTLKASNQNYTWYFQSVSGNVYKIKPGNYDYTYTITIKLINGNLEISGDTAANSENNWNGIWKKQ